MASPEPRAGGLSREEAAQLLGEQQAGGHGYNLQPGGWEAFARHYQLEGGAGQHISVFAPTEGGKTFLILHGLIEPFWWFYPVLWLRYKARDRTLSGFGQEVRAFPSSLQRSRYAHRRLDDPRWADDPEHFVLRLPEYHWSPDGKKQSKAWQEARRRAGEALDRAYHEGGWFVVVDEVLALSENDQPGLALRAPLENAWQRGRDQPLTLCAATQEPAGAPHSMYSMPRWIFIGRTFDQGRYDRLAEIGGDTRTMKAILPSLREKEFLAIDRWKGLIWRVKVPS